MHSRFRRTRRFLDSSRRYGEIHNRERWARASQEISLLLLQTTDEEEALALIAAKMREASQSDTALIVLPSVGDSYACEFANGDRADEMIGLMFPPNSRASKVMNSGTGIVIPAVREIPEANMVPPLNTFGPALYTPLITNNASTGVIILLRQTDRPQFNAKVDLPAARMMAYQVSIALQLASARQAEDRANMLEERSRIRRDLHDLVIQQLFATGMLLEAAREQVHTGQCQDPHHIVEVLDKALNSIDDSVGQIRQIVNDLRAQPRTEGIIDRVRQEVSMAREGLGFAPSLLLQQDGRVSKSEEEAERIDTELSTRISPTLADDVVAIVREGLANAARHAEASSLCVEIKFYSLAYVKDNPAHFVCEPGARGVFEVSIQDNGRGIDPQISRRSGLDNLRQRAEEHHGKFRVLSPCEDGHGTRICAQIPLG